MISLQVVLSSFYLLFVMSLVTSLCILFGLML